MMLFAAINVNSTVTLATKSISIDMGLISHATAFLLWAQMRTQSDASATIGIIAVNNSVF